MHIHRSRFNAHICCSCFVLSIFRRNSVLFVHPNGKNYTLMDDSVSIHLFSALSVSLSVWMWILYICAWHCVRLCTNHSSWCPFEVTLSMKLNTNIFAYVRFEMGFLLWKQLKWLAMKIIMLGRKLLFFSFEILKWIFLFAGNHLHRSGISF